MDPAAGERGKMLGLRMRAVIEWFSRFFHSYTFWPVLGAATLGGAFAVLTLGAFDLYCHNGATGLCGMIIAQPPWLLVTGVAATPSALLTWYWRTDHKKRDLLAAERSHELDKRAKISERFAKAIELLAQGRAGAIYALEQIARESPRDHWAVMKTLAEFARRAMIPGQGFMQLPLSVEAARAIGRREAANDPPGAEIDLTNADLQGGDFRDANFGGANLIRADLSNANFDGAMLADVRFDGADITRARFCGADLRASTITAATRTGAFYYDNATKFDVPLHIVAAHGGSNVDGGPDPLAIHLGDEMAKGDDDQPS